MGAIAAVVIGLAAYILSRPKERTTRWYKNEYAQAMRDLAGQRWFTPIETLYRRITNKRSRARLLPASEARAHFRRADEARLSLHNTGFLAVRRFTITNSPREEAAARIWKQEEPRLSRDERLFVNFTYPETDTNMLVIEGVAQNMGKWEAAVRQADVPGTK